MNKNVNIDRNADKVRTGRIFSGVTARFLHFPPKSIFQPILFFRSAFQSHRSSWQS